MTTRTTARRPNVGAPGFKALVTAMALAVTLGGWAVIASNSQNNSQTASNALPPMPTLVPTPAPYVAQTSRQSPGGQNSVRPNSPANTTAPRPRVVTIDPNLLPGPMAITRSSR